MGTPMAKNLEKAGFELSVYNRSADKTVAFENSGVTIFHRIDELVENSDIIFTMLSNDTAIQDVYNNILTLEALENKIFIDMSTISQHLSETVSEKIKKAGASFLDAPVAGSTGPAAQGTLIIMVGGDAETLNVVLPYLKKLGKLVKHMGHNGMGIAAKLAINYFVSLIYLGLAETVLFAGEKSITRADFLELINESALGNGATKIKTPLLVKDEYPAAFALDLMLKDILLAKESGVNYPLTDAIIDAYSQAHNKGYGSEDVMAIINYLKNKK